jgi:hypothetical protein
MELYTYGNHIRTLGNISNDARHYGDALYSGISIFSKNLSRRNLSFEFWRKINKSKRRKGLIWIAREPSSKLNGVNVFGRFYRDRISHKGYSETIPLSQYIIKPPDLTIRDYEKEKRKKVRSNGIRLRIRGY